MQFTVPPAAFSMALNAATRIISARTTLPILGHVLLEAAEEGGLSLRTTNLEISIRRSLAAVVSVDGACTVPAKLLSDFVGNLPPSESLAVALEQSPLDVKKLMLVLRCGSFETRIHAMSADEFPPGQECDPGDQLALPLGDFLDAVGRVGIAIHSGDDRPHLRGVLVTARDGVLTMTATDGHRLATKDIAVSEVEWTSRVIVPNEAIRELPRAFKGEAGHVEVAVSKAVNLISFRTATVELTSRLLEGEFPSYDRVIPRDNSVVVVMPSDELARAVRAVAVLGEDNHVIRMEVSEDGSLTLACQKDEVGSGRARVRAAMQQGAVKIALNSQYLTEALGAIPGDVELRLGAAMTPVLLTQLHEENYRHVIMPVKVTW